MFDLVRFAKEHMPPGSSIINSSSVVAYQVHRSHWAAPHLTGVILHHFMHTSATCVCMSARVLLKDGCTACGHVRKFTKTNTQTFK